MMRVALRGILGRKLRAALTGLAIVLGVAMISGTYVLTDTINASFDTIFSTSYKNADVIVTGKSAVGNTDAGPVETPSIPESLLTKIQKLPDVADAAGSLADENTKLVGKDGKVVTTHGAPTFGYSVDPRHQQFNPLSLTAGHWPTNATEVVIDENTANDEGFSVGDTIGVEIDGPVRQFQIAGIAKYAGVSSIGSATIAAFTPSAAQDLFGKQGKVDVIRVQSKAGVPTSKLLSEIRPLLPPTAQARDAAAQVKEDKKDVNGFLGFLQKALLAFAGIALFVGAFAIANTLSITIAQRAREFATLRTIGASRRQVLWSVVLEALVIGVLASLAGLFAGFGLAKLLNSAFVAFGIDLPQAGTVFATRTIVVSLVIGTVVTLLASLRPAFRATGVPPIAAVRERDADSKPDRLDGGGADDRARARHVRRRARTGDPHLVRGCGRPTVRRRLRDHVREHDHPPHGRRRAGSQGLAGRRRRVGHPRRRGEGVRFLREPHGRGAEPCEGDPHRLEGRQRPGSGAPWQGRGLRRRRLRKEQAPRARKAARAPVPLRQGRPAQGRGDLQEAERLFAVRAGDGVVAALRRELLAAAERDSPDQHARRHQRGEHGCARASAPVVRRREGADALRVQDELREADQQPPQPPVRPARAVGDHQPVRDRQHARADGLRADT